MDSQEKIYGKKVRKILEETKRDRIVLRLNLLGTGYEGLSIITGFENVNGESCLLIDYPSGFQDVASQIDEGRLFVEFNGPDRIQYTFRSYIHETLRDDLKIGFPESLERTQRRKHFRVTPPLGNKIRFSANGKRFEVSLINLSEGGALVSLAQQLHNHKELFVDGILRDLSLVDHEDPKKPHVSIQKAVIRRIEKKRDMNRSQYAIQFLHMKRIEASGLKAFIYECQRELLKKRNYIKDV